MGGVEPSFCYFSVIEGRLFPYEIVSVQRTIAHYYNTGLRTG